MLQAVTQPQPAPSAPPGAASLTLVHFGDLHVWRLGLDGELYPKRFLGLANLLLRRGWRFPEAVARAVMQKISREPADFILFSGDLTTTALREEFRVGRALFEPLRQRWGARLIAIPGNHDRYTPRAVRERRFETLFCAGANHAFPIAVDLDERWTLVGFDSAVARLVSSRGWLSEDDLTRLDAVLAEQQRRGRRLVVMGHYPLVFPPGMHSTWEHALPQRDRVRAILEQRGVSLYLHGHKHRRWRVELNGITHLDCGSAGQTGSHPERRPGYLKIHLGAGGLESVEAIWLAANPQAADAEDWRSEELKPLK